MEKNRGTYAYVVNTVPVNGQVEYRCLDIVHDVLWIDVTPKLPKKLKPEFPPYIPRFHTEHGTYLLLHDLEHLTDALIGFGFELVMPGILANMAKAKRIRRETHGNDLEFENGVKVPISRNKTKDYPHLVE